MTPREMKDSGVEWLREIPLTWSLQKISTFYSLRTQKVSDKDYPPLSVTKKGVLPQLESVAKTDDGDNRKLVKKGDFVINSRSDRRGSCGISPLDGSVSLINTVLIPRGQANPQYFDWLFHTDNFADEFYKWGSGIVDDLWSTRWRDMKRISIPVPDLTEQQLIAEFLNEKCSEIDSLTADIDKQIETLQEYKKSVITEAVTKGLDPNVEMKDSGIDWMKVIPNEWGITKIKYIAEIYGRIGFRGYTQQDLVNEGEGAITLSPSNLGNMKVDYTDCTYLSWYKYNESPEIMIHDGDVLLVKTGSTYGKASLVSNLPSKATINPQLVVFKNLRINNRLFTYLLQTDLFLDQCELAVVGGAIPTMAQSKILNFYIPQIPLSCQEDIVSYLDVKTSEINALVDSKRKQLDTLVQYKQSLIYEYVTGKKAVPM